MIEAYKILSLIYFIEGALGIILMTRCLVVELYIDKLLISIIKNQKQHAKKPSIA